MCSVHKRHTYKGLVVYKEEGYAHAPNKGYPYIRMKEKKVKRELD